MAGTVQDRILERLEVLGLSPRAASLQATEGRSNDLIRGILRDKDRVPRGDSLKRLAPVLQCSVEWLLTGNGPEPPGEPSPSDLAEASDQVPVRGTASGAVAGAFRLGGPVDSVPRPPGLKSARDVYAIFVASTSMMPEHNPGDLRYVNPHRPVRPDDSVIVEARWREGGDVEAYIGRFLGEDNDKVWIGKLNPKATVEFERRFVRSVHKVMTTNELFGV